LQGVPSEDVVNEIGIMQGRLVPRIDGRIQAFPWTSWQSEFGTAAAVGFDSIEFIFEGPNHLEHPLLTDAGRADIKGRVRESGIRVSSVCADFFMPNPLFRGSATQRRERLAVLLDLVRGAADVGARKIEIPCVDESSIQTDAERALLVDALRAALPTAEKYGVELLLETDLAPRPFASLLATIESPLVGANYDTGNSAALGYDAREEIAAYGDRILNIHIKDRALKGTTVPLGTGNADFDAVFSALRSRRYAHPFILQTARDPDDVGVARKYLAQVRGWVTTYLSRNGA
jgi:L-ribulose-5-phosphate 3-epimerase